MIASTAACGMYCATYGVPARMPITEDLPQQPINPYGATKLMIERGLRDYEPAYGLRSVALRYFNAAGCDPDGEVAGIYKSIARQVAVKVAARAKDFSARFPTITVSRDT